MAASKQMRYRYTMSTLTLALIFSIAFCAARLLILANVHLWLLSTVLKWSKGNASRFCLGLMLAVFSMSAIVPNVITVLAFIPVVQALLDRTQWDSEQRTQAVTAMTIAIIYAANIGGLASMIGTPANALFLIFCQQADIAAAQKITFFNWLLFGVPMGAALLLTAWATLLLTQKRALSFSLDHISRTPPAMTGKHTKLVAWAAVGLGLIVYLSIANDDAFEPTYLILWFVGFVALMGKEHGLRALVSDLPLRGILWLLAAIVVAYILFQGGVDVWLIDYVKTAMQGRFTEISALFTLILVTIFLTEILSNTVTTIGMWSIALLIAESNNLPPMPLLLSIGLAGTCAFMSPLATPATGMAFGSFKDVRLKAMLKSGFVLNVIAALFLTMSTYSWIPFVLGI